MSIEATNALPSLNATSGVVSPQAMSPLKSKKNKKASDFEVFTFDHENPFNGIIHRLSELCMGNPVSKNIIKITASSTAANRPSQVIDYDWTSHWVSRDEPDQWLQFDFRNLKFSIDSYCIKTYNYVAGGNHLKSWSIEVSANGNEWIDIDRRVNDDTLNGKSKIGYFQCNRKSEFRYLRILQKGTSWCDSDILSFTNIEFFGKLKVDKSITSI